MQPQQPIQCQTAHPTPFFICKSLPLPLPNSMNNKHKNQKYQRKERRQILFTQSQKLNLNRRRKRHTSAQPDPNEHKHRKLTPQSPRDKTPLTSRYKLRRQSKKNKSKIQNRQQVQKIMRITQDEKKVIKGIPTPETNRPKINHVPIVSKPTMYEE